MLIKNHLQLLENYTKERKDAYTAEEIDADSYFFTIARTILLKTTESSDLVRDLNIQPSLSKNSSMMTI